jgi:hypothetical protein
MSELKFSCPACDQHISCGKAYGGHVIHCPNCCAELRVPFADGNAAGELCELKAERVIDGHTAPPGTAGKTAPGDKELHCRCPVCQSNLRIPESVATQPDGIFPPAQLVLKPAENGNGSPNIAPPTEKTEPVAPLTEREQKIAAERAARGISLYPQMKPRLDLALGKQSSSESKNNKEEDPPSWMEEAA